MISWNVGAVRNTAEKKNLQFDLTLLHMNVREFQSLMSQKEIKLRSKQSFPNPLASNPKLLADI